MNHIEILNYQPKHQRYFEQFNREWIEEYFVMEPVDEFVLTNPDVSILKPGGAILMATYDGLMAGTVALRKVDGLTYEFTKMAVDKAFRRKGIASALCYASFKKAADLGATNVILYSNSKKNGNAIEMYRKIGFHELPLEPGIYERADIKMKIELETTDKNPIHHSPLTIHN